MYLHNTRRAKRIQKLVEACANEGLTVTGISDALFSHAVPVEVTATAGAQRGNNARQLDLIVTIPPEAQNLITKHVEVSFRIEDVARLGAE